MALDPDTGLFPETFVEPFIKAPELARLAMDVMSDFDEFRPVLDAVDDGLRIAYVWETKPFDPAKDTFKPHTIAKVTKAGPLWRCLAETELVIQFRQTFWGPFTEAQRRAVVHHELTHIEVDEPDEQGRVKLSLREHDVEDFAKTMRRFGPIIPGRATFVKAFLDWQHEQETPAPTPLRSVEEIAHDLVDAIVADPDARASDHATIDANAAVLTPGVSRAVRKFRDSVEAGTIDVTVTGGGRSTTIKGKGRRPTASGGPKADLETERCPSPGCVRWADHAGDHDPGDA